MRLWFYFSCIRCVLINSGFLAGLSTIYNSKIRRMEGQTKRYRGVDEAPSTTSRTTRTYSSVCAIQMAFHQRCRWRVHFASLAFGHPAWYSKASLSGPCSSCKSFLHNTLFKQQRFWEENYIISSWISEANNLICHLHYFGSNIF